MTAKEFQKVFKAAEAGVGTVEEYGSLYGIGTHNDRVACTLGGCAAFVRYQARYLGGGWDTEELSRLQHCFKRVTLLT